MSTVAAYFLLILVPLITRVSGNLIGCGLIPDGQDRSNANPEPKFGITVNSSSFTVGGDPVKVTLKSTGIHASERILFKHFTLQAHDVLDHVHGRWEPISEELTTMRCHLGDKDTLYNTPNMADVLKIEANWYPDFPETEEIYNKDIDINAAVLLGDGRFWTDIRSVVLKAHDVHDDPSEDEHADPDTQEEETDASEPDSETEGTGEDPNGGEMEEEGEREREAERDSVVDHGIEEEEELARKAKEEMEQRIRDEDNESEGELVKEEEEKRREEEERQDQEMVEYEREQAKEERERQEMIQWEIRDKEEHERVMAEDEDVTSDEENEMEIDKDLDISGSVIPMIHIGLALLPLVLLVV